MKVRVEAGFHDRINCPIFVESTPAMQGKSWELATPSGSLPLQLIDDKNAAFLLKAGLPAESSIEFELVEVEAPSMSVRLTEHESHLSIVANDDLLTNYHFGNVPARPYFFPLNAPGRISCTRAYPMISNVEGETSDHKHHRSVWIAHGEVNGVDNWSEEPGHGFTKHCAFNKITNGAVFGGFVSDNLWTDSAGKSMLNQKLELRIWAPPSSSVQLLDFKIELTAAFGDVLFGDTKEGGILSVRVASELDVTKTGRITNVFGGVNEGETWGKASHWCDYSGLIGGKAVGIAVMDHPHSFRHPSHWHVRNYGLMTANPFGYSHYTNGMKEGSHLLKSGETLGFNYRMILHRGDVHESGISQHYLNYSSPPKTTILL